MAREIHGKHPIWVCDTCAAGFTTLAALRRDIPGKVLDQVWSELSQHPRGEGRLCPDCCRAMTVVGLEPSLPALDLDVCRSCQAVFFDPGEEHRLPRIRELDRELQAMLREHELQLERQRPDATAARILLSPSRSVFSTSLEILASLLSASLRRRFRDSSRE